MCKIRNGAPAKFNYCENDIYFSLWLLYNISIIAGNRTDGKIFIYDKNARGVYVLLYMWEEAYKNYKKKIYIPPISQLNHK